MDVDFKQMSEAVMTYIMSQGRGKETKRSYLRCFASLESYLNEKEVVYSQEAASAWLSTVNALVNKTEFSLYCAAVNKLNDLLHYGEIHKGHYNPAKTIVGKLCPEFKRILNLLLEHISDRSDGTVSSHSWQCASILLHFQRKDVNSAADITYGILLDEYNSSSGKTYYSRCAHHGSLRLLLQVLYEKEHVPYGFTVFVDAMNTRPGYFWNRMPE